MIELGIVDPNWEVAEWESRHWNELTENEQHNSALRMSVYAAQIYALDYNIGKLINHLEEKGILDNTLIVFLSDNGACAEPYSETGSGSIEDINNPKLVWRPSYGLPWSQVSNTPYRKYKVRAYEGGISTPLIVSWKSKYQHLNNSIRTNVGFLPDIMATFIEVANAKYPTTFHNGNKITPLVGTSLTKALDNPNAILHEYLFGEHYENQYVRWNDWKAIKDQESDCWELYNIKNDRTERHNLSAKYPDILNKLIKKWNNWAADSNVYPKNPTEKKQTKH